MSNSFIHFLCKEENKEAAVRLGRKLAEEAKPGAIILLDKEEWDVLSTMRTVQIGAVKNPGIHENDT